MYRSALLPLSGVSSRSWVVAFVTLAMMGQEAQASFRSQLFESAFLSFDTSGWPVGATLGDLNGDQRLDLVLMTGGSQATVHLGQVDGLFGPGTDYPISLGLLLGGTQPMELADLNKDGSLDIVAVVADVPDGEVGVLLGNGDGSFGPATVYPMGAHPLQAVVADLNGDQNPDVAVVNRADNMVSIRLGDGTGALGPRTSFGTGGDEPLSLDAGDLNGDTKQDLAFANASGNTITLLRGEGDGTFPTPLTFAIPGSARPGAIVLRDVSSDQNLDLVFGDLLNGNVSVILGNGDGSFLFPRFDFATGGDECLAVEVVDVDGNGTQDLAVATDAGLSVLLGDGVGGFGAAQLASNPGSVSLALGQLDWDGKLDAVVDNGSSAYSVLFGNGDGTFGDTANDVVAGDSPASVALGLMDADAHLDIVVANSGTPEPGENGYVSILRGNGDGSFTYQGNFDAGALPSSVTLADFDDDDALDAAVANGGIVFRFCGQGVTLPCCDPLFPILCNPVREVESMTVSVLLGGGDASLDPKDDYFVGNQPSWVEAADLNADLIPDLVTANPDDHTVSVLLGAGDGTFGVTTDYETNFDPRALAIEDLNGDLIPDLVVACSGVDSVSVLLGLGGGDFGPRTEFQTAASPISVVVVELTGDSHLDLVLGGAVVTLLPGNGDGTFGAPETLAAGGFPTVADVDGDSFLDLVVATPGVQAVYVVYGLGGGLFGERIGYGLDQNALFVTTADVNADGWTDIVAPKYSDDEVQVLVNRATSTDVATGRPPTLVRLRPSWPNPVRGTSRIEFSLPTRTHVSLRVLDVRGRLVRTLLHGPRPAGSHVQSWDLRSSRGARVASGVYFYELRWPQGRQSRSLVVAD